MAATPPSGLRRTATRWLFPPPVLSELTDVAAGQTEQGAGGKINFNELTGLTTVG